MTTLMALGGSTNAVVHLSRSPDGLGFRLTLDDFDRISRTTPCLANIKPSGEYPDGGFLPLRRSARAAPQYLLACFIAIASP